MESFKQVAVSLDFTDFLHCGFKSQNKADSAEHMSFSILHDFFFFPQMYEQFTIGCVIAAAFEYKVQLT